MRSTHFQFKMYQIQIKMCTIFTKLKTWWCYIPPCCWHSGLDTYPYQIMAQKDQISQSLNGINSYSSHIRAFIIWQRRVALDSSPPWGISHYTLMIFHFKIHLPNHPLFSCQFRHPHTVAAVFYESQEISHSPTTKILWLLAARQRCIQIQALWFCICFPSNKASYAIYLAEWKPSLRIHLPWKGVWNALGYGLCAWIHVCVHACMCTCSQAHTLIT